MGKWLTVGMTGFLLGMRYVECGRKLCARQIKKKAMKLLSLMGL